jgi:hypothetical protein
MVLRGWKGKQVLGVCDDCSPSTRTRTSQCVRNTSPSSSETFKPEAADDGKAEEEYNPIPLVIITILDEIKSQKQRSRLGTCVHWGSSASSWLHLHHLSEGNSAHMPKTLLKLPTFTSYSVQIPPPFNPTKSSSTTPSQTGGFRPAQPLTHDLCQCRGSCCGCFTLLHMFSDGAIAHLRNEVRLWGVSCFCLTFLHG